MELAFTWYTNCYCAKVEITRRMLVQALCTHSLSHLMWHQYI